MSRTARYFNKLRPWACGITVAVSTPVGLAQELGDPNTFLGQNNRIKYEQQREIMADTLAPVRALQAQSFGVEAETPPASRELESIVPGITAGAGVLRMKELLHAIQSENYDALDERTRQAIQTTKKSVEHAAKLENMDAQTAWNAVGRSESWHKQAVEAYIAALPPRDRELGRSVLAGDGTLPNAQGHLYIFVSRSMPDSLLRAYAMDALYTGASLIVKGIRRGDTVKDYVVEMLEDYNSTDGQILASMEINPNLFDMFGVDVVPAVVWTNRGGLDDVGSGCVSPPDFATPTTTVKSPDFTDLVVEKPTCMLADETSYYKLAGALKMEYVLERFSQAGAPAFAIGTYTERLAERHKNVHQAGRQPTLGNAMPTMPEEITVDRLPRHILEAWKADLKQSNVRRGPYGPTFTEDEEDDTVYRQELLEKIRHGLGL